MKTFKRKQGGQLKATRILSLYSRLIKGELISKSEEARFFNVDMKTIQRDINDLRAFLSEFGPNNQETTIVYDRKRDRYRFERNEQEWLSNQEVLVLAKILLESRALEKQELENLIRKLLTVCSEKDRKHVHDVILSERAFYTPVKHQKPLIHWIWDFSLAVREQRLVRLRYQKVRHSELVDRLVKPLGILFSEYYFYLLAYIVDFPETFPVVYRLDRVVSYQVQSERFRVPYSERFSEGDFRKKVQFMQSGELLKITFKFWGKSLEAVLDRLPTARVIKTDGEVSIIEAEVYGRGVKMWLLSQAEYLEVLTPTHFREEMKRTIYQMMKLYD